MAAPDVPTIPLSTSVPLEISSIGNISAHVQPPQIPPHRSHSPSNNLKRSDPFQFGSRYLEEGDDVYEFNAWDHVEVDETYKEYAELQYTRQREAPVSDFDKKRFNDDPARWWNLFYRKNQMNFFKNRKWLRQEFPILAHLIKPNPSFSQLDSRTRILEVGAGAGNTAFPILAANQNPGLCIHACDFSNKAVELIRLNPAYDEHFIKADVWDVTSESNPLPPGVEAGSIDVVLLIFIFSALAPRQWAQAVSNIWRCLKPGGEVCFRDYGRGDLAQVRFKKGRYMDENNYVRGDGTRVYFFEKEELEHIWGNRLEERGTLKNGDKEMDASESDFNYLTSAPNFEIMDLGVDRRLIVNRQKKLKMYRCWQQGRFRKPPRDLTLYQEDNSDILT